MIFPVALQTQFIMKLCENRNYTSSTTFEQFVLRKAKVVIWKLNPILHKHTSNFYAYTAVIFYMNPQYYSLLLIANKNYGCKKLDILDNLIENSCM